MPPAPDPRHPALASPSAGSGPDLKIPPPNAGQSRPANDFAQTTPPPAPVPDPAYGMSSTELVIATVLVLAWAGLLILVKRLLTQSLVGQFADLGRSRAAGTTLYVFLLVLGATLVFCALGGYWQALVIVIPAGVLDAVLLILFLFTLASARASRQRR